METEPKENSELLLKGRHPDLTKGELLKSERNGNLRNSEISRGPPDGGLRAYSVLVGSFLTNGLLFGVINCYGVIYKELKQHTTVQNTVTKASLAGSLAMGVTFLLSPLSGVLTRLLGIRLTAVLGGTIATCGLLLSSFVVNNFDALCFTYGVLYGLGASLAYTPSLAILGHYFKKYLGIVNGIVTVGSSVFTVIMPHFISGIMDSYGMDWMFRALAVVTLGIAFCGFLFKPTPLMLSEKQTREGENFTSLMKTAISVDIWKNKKYRLWAMSMPVALFGYFVPYIHMEQFTESNIVSLDKKFIHVPIQCIAAASGIGRLIFGFLADKPGIDRIMLQQISFYVIGTLTIILPFVTSFEALVAISLGMGIFDGAFISLIGPIAFELCGGAYAAQAIGCMLGLASFPLSFGPPVASLLYETTKSYTLPFVLAGISPLVGATLMFGTRFHRRQRNETVDSNTNGRISTDLSDTEKARGSSRIPNGNSNPQTSL